MASPASLNATAAVINGGGLGANVALISAITSFQNDSTIKLIANIYNNTNTSNYSNASVISNIALAGTVVNTLASNVSQGLFLLDMYPSNITPACSTTYSSYGNLASFSSVIKAQAQAPFASGMAGFANVYFGAQSHISSVFDTVSSIYLLQNRTYGNTGISYSGVTDHITGGIGSNAVLLANVVSNWGTFYDIAHINLLADPYVFGQNLLNQNLGTYGSLSDQLTAAGLDVADITKIPDTQTTTSQQHATRSVSTAVGEIQVPVINSVTSTNLVTANNPGVVTAIYQSVTGANLSTILSTTGFTVVNPAATTLADYLTFNKVVDPSLLTSLSLLGITDFTSFSNYITARVGQGYFTSWSAMATFLRRVQAPTLAYTTSNSSSTLLSSSTISTLNNNGVGTGPFGNQVLGDFFGATSGYPYASLFNTINANKNSITGLSSLRSAVVALDSAITAYVNYFSSYIPPVGTAPTLTSISTAVAAVKTALGALSGSALTASQAAVYTMLNKLAIEVSNLSSTNLVFGSAPTSLLSGFAQGVPRLASTDNSGAGAPAFFANIITNDTS